MSKRAARREKARKERHLSLRSGYIVALVLVVVGIIGTIFSIQKANEYENSTDKRTVTATVYDLDTVTRKDENGFRKMYWKAKLSYEVEGEIFKDSALFENEVKVGDQKEIDIYRTPTGNYRIPRDSEQKLAKFLFIAIALVGVVTAGLSRFVFSEPKRSARRAGSRKKHRRRDQEYDTDEMTDLTDRQRVRRSDRPRRKRRTKRSSEDQ
jgi:flagellar basal body-associated protein FliL